MSVWQQVVTVLVSGTTILTIVAFLIRSIVRHVLDKDLAVHQAKLDAKHERELERTRSALQKDFLEHEVRFRTLHAKVAETIAETFSHLVALQTAVGSYVAELEYSNGPTKKEKLEAVSEAFRAFSEYFFPREIYLPPDLGSQIRTLYAKLHQITNKMTLSLQMEESPTRQTRDLWAEGGCPEDS